MNAKQEEPRPLSFTVAKWYGYIFSALYILYGGVSIVLGMMDRNYENIAMPFVFLILGFILLAVSFAFAEEKRWGWYGMVGIAGLAIVGSLFSPGLVESWVIIVISAGVIALLFMGPTRERFQ